MQDGSKNLTPLKGEAFGTTAAEGFDKSIEILLPVVVRQLLSGFDTPFGDDKNVSATIDRLTIRPTGMIDIAGRIKSRTTIDIDIRANIEDILVTERIAHLSGNAMPDIFDDRLTFGYGGKRDQSQTGSRFFYPHIKLARRLFHRFSSR